MPKSVYVETSIFSFYYDERTSPEIVARRQWTRQWWTRCTRQHALLTSTAVLVELRRGRLPHRAKALALARTLPAMTAPDELEEIVQIYIRRHVMPADPTGDALHLALASHYRCDFLLTWNCQHLANANKFGHIRRVNTLLGLHVPTLVTPLELLGVSGDET
jgi:predicted nucleic acid-binding protein